MSNEETSLENDEASAPSIEMADAIVNKYFALPAELDTEKLDKILALVTEHYKDDDDLQLDASHITTMTTAAVQSFICLNRYTQSNQKHLEWLNPSPAFMDAFNNLGLYSAMMKMEMK